MPSAGLYPVYKVRLLGVNRLGLIFFYNESFVLTTDTNTDPKVTSPVSIQKLTPNNTGQIWKIVGGPQPFPFVKTNYSACLQNLTVIP
uniref:Uncharacterized protein n=1 Tax=Romanomermis culicivorax TaxID=13658 RepID=A0A915HXV9_ROMCU